MFGRISANIRFSQPKLSAIEAIALSGSGEKRKISLQAPVFLSEITVNVSGNQITVPSAVIC